MLNSVIQKIIYSKEKGLKVDFKTDGKKFFVHIANSLYVTLNEKEFQKVYSGYQNLKVFSK